MVEIISWKRSDGGALVICTLKTRGVIGAYTDLCIFIIELLAGLYGLE